MGQPADPSPVRARLVEDYLRAESISAGKTIARWGMVVASIQMMILLMMWAFGRITWGFAWPMLVMLLLVIGWCWWQASLMARGWFHPVISWINVTIEVSIVGVAFSWQSISDGPEQAIASPSVFLWGGLVMLSALRSNRRLGLYAGGLAAVELLTVYFLLDVPRFSHPPVGVFALPSLMVRAWMLLVIGALASIIGGRSSAKIEKGLAVLRSRDLMGKYLLHERLGSGGMAEVFRATYSPEGGFEKPVAVKRVLPAYLEDRDFIDMFRREAMLGSSLNHPNVVQVLDMGSQDGAYFLVMEYVDGRTLRSVLAGGIPLSFAAVVWLAAELAAALDYIHTRTGPDGSPLGLVHRDLNPPNVLLSRRGEVKLADFGIARAAHEATMTREGRVRGKAGYLSPEQIREEKLDGRSDLFALGLTLYEALTGKRAIQGSTDEERRHALLVEPITPPSQLREGIPAELDRIVQQLLLRDLRDRMPSAAELTLRLKALVASPGPWMDGRAQLAVRVNSASAETAPSRVDPAATVSIR